MTRPDYVKCENCVFFLKATPLGYCHKDAPGDGGYFPQMSPVNWCGEFRREWPESEPDKADLHRVVPIDGLDDLSIRGDA